MSPSVQGGFSLLLSTGTSSFPRTLSNKVFTCSSPSQSLLPREPSCTMTKCATLGERVELSFIQSYSVDPRPRFSIQPLKTRRCYTNLQMYGFFGKTGRSPNTETNTTISWGWVASILPLMPHSPRCLTACSPVWSWMPTAIYHCIYRTQ